jgi:hypothetical protein
MSEIKDGSAVTCGICRKETNVRFVTEREGAKSYDLVCWHRNAVCPNCGDLVRDKSEVIQEVHPHCDKCDGPYFDDDEDE